MESAPERDPGQAPQLALDSNYEHRKERYLEGLRGQLQFVRRHRQGTSNMIADALLTCKAADLEREIARVELGIDVV
jgi:hypothetical protein